MTTSHVVAVVLDDTLLTLNRAVGVLRRRNIAVTHLTVRDGGMTFTLNTDAATADRVVQQLRKVAGVATVDITTTQHEGAVMSSPQVRVFYDADADPARLKGKVIAVIGYGSQGHAHSLNLRDSKARVIVGLREGGASWSRAKAEGLDVRPVAEAARAADIIMMLVPDQEARAVYEASVAGALTAGKTLLFAHGFNVHFKEIVPPADVDVDDRAQVARPPGAQ